MAGKWRLARFRGQLAVNSGAVQVRTFRGRQGPFATLALSEGDLTLVVADPAVLGQLAQACWRASDALGRMQLDPPQPGQVPGDSADAGRVA